MNWYLHVLKKYAVFSERARRKEYWMFVLFNMVFALVAMILDNVFGIAIEGVGYGPIYILYTLAILIPGIAVTVRRLHDTGKSGWMVFVALIPIVGAIWLLILMLTEGSPGENEYGQNPKDTQPDIVAKDGSIGDIVILIAIIWMVLSRIFWVIIPRISEEYYLSQWFEKVNMFFVLFWALIPISLAFAIKNKSIQIGLFIIGAIYFLYGAYEIILKITS
jgi:uncharacterized membrane protein YhaH (DUF805 family)